MKQGRLSEYLGDRSFYRAVWILVVPMTLQQLASAVFSFADSALLANVGEAAMSAVTVAGKPTVLYNGLLSGLTGATSLLISQYHGAGKLHICQRIFSVQMAIGLLLSALYAAALYLFPETVMRMFVQDASMIEAGVQYLRIVVWMYIPMAFSLCCLYSLRAIGVTVMPMLISLLTIVLSIALEWVFMFGMLGLPRLGVRGAALGALLARVVEMGAYALMLLSNRTAFRLRLSPALQIGKDVLLDCAHKALPLTVNELLWSLGQITIFWGYARVGEAFLPAINVSDQVVAISTVPIHAMGAAAAVLVGRKLGANQFDEVRRDMKRLFGFSMMLSLLSAGAALLFAIGIGFIFPALGQEQLSMARRMIELMLCFFPCSAAFVLSFFILRAGGDIRRVLLLDSGYVWVLPAPVALLIGFFFSDKLDIFSMVLLLQVLQGLKTLLAVRAVRHGAWLQNLTREHA